MHFLRYACASVFYVKAIVSVSSVLLHSTFLFRIFLGTARSIASERSTTLMMVNGVGRCIV